MPRINRYHLFMAGVFLLMSTGSLMAPPIVPADLDGDGDVDNVDVEGFIGCISGQGVAPTSLCESADMNGDGDVDQADFGIVQRCISGDQVWADPSCAQLPPRLASYGNSGCLNMPLFGDDYPWCGDDVLELTVEGNSLRLVHRSATYNCCPDDILVELTVDGHNLFLEEREIITLPCPCLCCYDVESVIVDLPDGYYWVSYCWNDWESGQVCETQLVRVP